MTDRDPSRSKKKRPNMAPPRVFLGSMVIAKRAGTVFLVEKLFNLYRENLQIRLIDALMDLVALPTVETREDKHPDDLALDLNVPYYRTGQFGSYWGWRPKVIVSVRLYHIDTGQTIFTDEVTETVVWSAFFRRALNPLRHLMLKPMFSPEEMETLLVLATTHLLTRVHSQV